MMNYFSEMPLEPKDPEILGYCAHCGDEVYDGENAFLGQEGYIHAECMIDFIQNSLSVGYLAKILGYIMVCDRRYE